MSIYAELGALSGPLALKSSTRRSGAPRLLGRFALDRRGEAFPTTFRSDEPPSGYFGWCLAAKMSASSAPSWPAVGDRRSTITRGKFLAVRSAETTDVDGDRALDITVVIVQDVATTMPVMNRPSEFAVRVPHAGMLPGLPPASRPIGIAEIGGGIAMVDVNTTVCLQGSSRLVILRWV